MMWTQAMAFGVVRTLVNIMTHPTRRQRFYLSIMDDPKFRVPNPENAAHS